MMGMLRSVSCKVPWAAMTSTRRLVGRGRTLSTLAVLAVGALGLSACSQEASGAAPDSSTSPEASASAVLSPSPTASEPIGRLRLSLDFEGLARGDLKTSTSVPDQSGARNDGHVVLPARPSTAPLPSVVATERGHVLRFSNPCNKGPLCVRPILEVPDASGLNPGSANFAFGAAIRMKAADRRDGANLIQKGYAIDGNGQWKLQVDDPKGRPSCVLVETETGEIEEVVGRTSVTDGTWHAISCERRDNMLRILVDGSEDGVTRSDRTLFVANPTPVRIAGKHVRMDGDFFFGEIDDLFVRLGR